MRLRVSCEIHFEHPMIRSANYSLEVTPKRLVKEICHRPDLGFVEQLERLRATARPWVVLGQCGGDGSGWGAQ